MKQRTFVAVAVLASACGRDSGAACLALPCPLPLAVYVTVTSSASSGPVTGAFVLERSPGISTPIPCNTTCIVPGTAGTYQLDIGAPGFTTVHLAVQVRGTSKPCGCDTVEPEHVDVALVPAP
ncbi:MAG: hypothetical protein ACHQQ3_11040 [Gemmatimonadales bacterium]